MKIDRNVWYLSLSVESCVICIFYSLLGRPIWLHFLHFIFLFMQPLVSGAALGLEGQVCAIWLSLFSTQIYSLCHFVMRDISWLCLWTDRNSFAADCLQLQRWPMLSVPISSPATSNSVSKMCWQWCSWSRWVVSTLNCLFTCVWCYLWIAFLNL